MPKISVIITSYNKGKLLHEAINSVLNQQFGSIEIIVIDDCSSDKVTREELKKINAEQIKLILLEQNVGVCEARNIAIKQSKGEYILLLDADDYIGNGYIDEAASILDNSADIKIVGCEVQLFGASSGNMELPEPTIENFIARNALVVSSFFRRSDFDRTTGFSQTMKGGFEDWDFWLSILETGGKAYRIPKPYFYYRISRSSRNQSIDAEKFKKLRTQIYTNHKDLYAKYLLDPTATFEYYLIKDSVEYKIGTLLLKPLRTIQRILSK